MLKNMLWAYINERYENDGVLPDADEVYEKFKLEFDTGAPMEWVDEQMYNFTRCHDLSGIEIQYEGEIFNMGAYDTPSEKCPYCGDTIEADYVDVGVGMVQCGPYHCYTCGASEIGPELFDWYYKDREGKTLYLTAKRKYVAWAKKKVRWAIKPVLKPGHPFSEKELETGFYQGKISPYANTVNGELVDHKEAKAMYDKGLLDEKTFKDEMPCKKP